MRFFKGSIIACLIVIFCLVGCNKNNNSLTQSTTDEPSITITTPQDDKTKTKEDETANMKLTLKIDGIEVDVIRTDNNSVKVLKNLAKDGLTVSMEDLSK